MLCRAKLAALPIAAWIAVGCGSGRPADATIYHDPALRPGVVQPADASEQQILDRITAAGDAPVELDGMTVEAAYTAASGRRCRRVRATTRALLACDGEDGWVFVPHVLGSEVAE